MPIPGFAGSDGKIYCVSDSKPSFVGRRLLSIKSSEKCLAKFQIITSHVVKFVFIWWKGGGADILDRLIHAVLERAFYTVSLNRVKSIFWIESFTKLRRTHRCRIGVVNGEAGWRDERWKEDIMTAFCYSLECIGHYAFGATTHGSLTLYLCCAVQY